MARVGIIGATGHTGSSILTALLAAGPQDFQQIVAFARPSSLSKPANLALEAKGVELRSLDLASASQADLVTSLTNIDILISAIGGADQLAQIPLAAAAKAAGVKRYVPCAFLPVIPAGGINHLRDQKQQVYDNIFQLGLPYTIIDVGWWYQISVPSVPSGKLDAHVFFKGNEVAGDGTVLSGLTDLEDIGKYVAKIVLDDRTLNKWVFVYNELWSQNSAYDLVERKTGEKVERSHVSEAELLARIAGAGDSTDMADLMVKIPAQYMRSWGIRGENTPEYAKYLGYLTSKDLYPDMQFKPFESYIDDALAGTAGLVYQEHK